MTLGLFVWGLTGLFMGYTGGTHDVKVLAWIILALAAAFWLFNTIHSGLVKQANASDLLRATDERRKTGGAC